MASLGGIDLGAVQSEQQSKDSNLFQQPLPRSDSENAILLDLFGCLRTISISGVITGTEATQRTFISNIDNIINGSQGTSAFVSSIVTSPASFNVFIQNFSWTKNSADTSKLDYSLTLIEGAAVA